MEVPLAGPLAEFSMPMHSAKERPGDAAAQLARNGLLHVRHALPLDVAKTLLLHVDAALTRRRADSDPRWFGNVYGYEDKGKRWDLKLTLCPEVTAALHRLLEILPQMLLSEEMSWKLTELAAMCTTPGDPGQPVHADTAHTEDHHVVTIFVALHDIEESQGPTRMYPRTHADGPLHMGLKTLDENCGVLCTMACGDCVIMDSRLMHCGTANTSQNKRYLFYCSWMPQGLKSLSSTNTLLESYEDRLLLNNWQKWTAEPPAAAISQAVRIVPAQRPTKRKRRSHRSKATHARIQPRSDILSMPDPRVETLLTWLRDTHGVDLAVFGVEVRCSHGIGIFATRKLYPTTTLASIPMAAVLHAGKVRSCEFGQRVVATLQHIDGHSEPLAIAPEELLWLYMVWGRAERACPWFPYLRALPAEDPFAWRRDAGALRWLEGTRLRGTVSEELERQRRRHASITERLCAGDPDRFQRHRFTFDDWLWARACYVSRALPRRSFPSESIQEDWESDFLCPLLDIFNHMHSAQVEHRFGEGSAAFVLPVTAAAYEAGDEIFNLYSPDLGNESLLSHYGFALRGNPYNSLNEVRFKLPADDVASRLAYCRAAGIQLNEAEGFVWVYLSKGIHLGLAETPVELLRATSLLLLQRDYDEDTADCSEKATVSRLVAKNLNSMLCYPRFLHLVGRAAKRMLARRHHVVSMGAGERAQCRAEPVVERSPRLYALGRLRILKEASACAECEAEMAELAMKMELEGCGSDDANDNDEEDAVDVGSRRDND